MVSAQLGQTVPINSHPGVTCWRRLAGAPDPTSTSLLIGEARCPWAEPRPPAPTVAIAGGFVDLTDRRIGVFAGDDPAHAHVIPSGTYRFERRDGHRLE